MLSAEYRAITVAIALQDIRSAAIESSQQFTVQPLGVDGK